MCRIPYDWGTGTWIKTHNGKRTLMSIGNQPMMEDFHDHYDLTMSKNKDVYNLTINGVMETDAGMYDCKSGSDRDSLLIRVSGNILWGCVTRC